jgi:hypothetical protein
MSPRRESQDMHRFSTLRLCPLLFHPITLIKDPTQNINWVPPEGGGGPHYPGGM